MDLMGYTDDTRRGWIYQQVMHRLNALAKDELISAMDATIGQVLALETDSEGYVRMSYHEIRAFFKNNPHWSHALPSINTIRETILKLELLEVLVVDWFRQSNKPFGYAWLFDSPPPWRTNHIHVSDPFDEFEEE